MKKIEVDFLSEERWFMEDTSFADDMKKYWGDWGVASEVNRLRSVLVRRPGKEIDMFDHEKVRFTSPIIPELFRVEHDALCDVYRSYGVKVYYVENMRTDRPNSVFMRDLMFMTPEGAIVGRPIKADRRGEERYVAEQLAKVGVPIVSTINGNGFFEGSNAMWVDRYTVLLATSCRTNLEGIKQVEYQLSRMGVTNFIYLRLPNSYDHIDELINFAAENLVMVNKNMIPYDVCIALKNRGYQIINASLKTEIHINLGVDFIAIKPNLVIQPAGNPRCQELLEKHGVKVITIPYSEMLKGSGGIYSVTAVLKRDLG